MQRESHSATRSHWSRGLPELGYVSVSQVCSFQLLKRHRAHGRERGLCLPSRSRGQQSRQRRGGLGTAVKAGQSGVSDVQFLTRPRPGWDLILALHTLQVVLFQEGGFLLDVVNKLLFPSDKLGSCFCKRFYRCFHKSKITEIVVCPTTSTSLNAISDDLIIDENLTLTRLSDPRYWTVGCKQEAWTC